MATTLQVLGGLKAVKTSIDQLTATASEVATTLQVLGGLKVMGCAQLSNVAHVVATTLQVLGGLS